MCLDKLMAENSLSEHQFSVAATAVSYDRSRPIQPPFNIVYWPLEIAEHYCRRAHRGNHDKQKNPKAFTSVQSIMETIGEGMEAKIEVCEATQNNSLPKGEVAAENAVVDSNEAAQPVCHSYNQQYRRVIFFPNSMEWKLSRQMRRFFSKLGKSL